MDKQIPLYDYQKQVSDEMVPDILSSTKKYLINYDKLIIEYPITQLASPLGSGKTRIMCRTIDIFSKKCMEQSYKPLITFNDKKCIIMEDDEKDEKEKLIIFIIVPVSILYQWVEELNLWKINYNLIEKPKQLKMIIESGNLSGIYLISSIRINDIIKDYPYLIRQSHVFIDEFDTIDVKKLYLLYTTSITCTICSANNNFYDNHQFVFDINLHEISDQEVSNTIKLPDVITIKEETLMSNNISRIYPFLADYSKRLIDIGDFTSFFKNYSLTEYNLFDLLTKQLEDLEKSIINYSKLAINNKFYNRLFINSKREKEIFSLILNEWKDKYKGMKNCSVCFDFSDDLNKNNTCNQCLVGNNKSRIGSLNKILNSIKSRPGRSKKVLIYCSSNQLINDLEEHLKKSNIWIHVLEGSSTIRQKILDKYNETENDIYLLCNSISNSAGLHLPKTTDIVIYHKLDKKYDIQVTGRGQRPGRIDNLYVYRIE